MRRTKKGPALFVVILMLIIIAIYVCVAYQMVKPSEDRICDGVFIESIDLGGMSQVQAEVAVTAYVDEYLKRTLQVDIDGKTVSATLEELGYQCVDNDYIKQAMQVGKKGNLFTNYAEIEEAEKNSIVYELDFTSDEKTIKRFVKKKCKKKCTKAKNAGITMSDGALTYTDSKDGITLNVADTVSRICTAIEEDETSDVIQVTAEVKVKKATVTKDLVSRCQDKLGSYQTSFNASNVSRSKNVANAAKLINGSVVYPGETFSVHDAISPMTEDNGYYAAPSYSNGEVVDSIGGGVCQVSTTLYNAVLRAELEVVERSPHSMVVSYVEPSMDAAIAGDYKDFKFKNDTDVPLYIEGGTYSGIVYFNVYGEETRSEDRVVTFESETIETIEPGEDKITYDDTKPESYEKVTQEAHTGYKAVLWKIVTENGETTKTQVNSSTYQAEPRYVTKGSAKSTTAPTASPTPKATDNSNSKKDNKATATPKASKATATPTPQTQTVEPVGEE